MLKMIDDYLAKPEHEKRMYQAARRMALVVSPKEMSRLGIRQTEQIENLISAIPDPYQWEVKMNELICRYI